MWCFGTWCEATSRRCFLSILNKILRIHEVRNLCLCQAYIGNLILTAHSPRQQHHSCLVFDYFARLANDSVTSQECDHSPTGGWKFICFSSLFQASRCQNWLIFHGIPINIGIVLNVNMYFHFLQRAAFVSWSEMNERWPTYPGTEAFIPLNLVLILDCLYTRELLPYALLPYWLNVPCDHEKNWSSQLCSFSP